MASWHLEQGDAAARHLILSRAAYYIGRASGSDLVLTHKSVSRRHAKLTRQEDGVYVIQDLESTNGITVNDERIEKRVLRNGDRIGIGTNILVFRSDEVQGQPLRPEAVVRVTNVYKQYTIGKQSVTALHDVSLEVDRGEFMALAGPSGSGKSTLLNLIGCIDTPTVGDIFIVGNKVSEKSPDELAGLRAETLGFIFQNFNLFPVLTARENVEYPLLQNRKLGRAERRKRIEHYLDVVGLTRFMNHRPSELSGGQRQRVAIARALAAQPEIVLADEPTANLDHATGEGILELMRDMNRDEGTTFIFSTHDQRVMELADRVVNLVDGVIVDD